MVETATAAVSADTDEDAVQGVYHFLDVGGTKYGECTLVVFGDLRILIDGSHQQDFRGQRGYLSIPEQLENILGGPPPYKIDLVVVTHCHADHVGCLPDLVASDTIKPTFALLTDPNAGFGRRSSEDAPRAEDMSAADRLAALLREEDASDLDDAELAAFIADVATVESRYLGFIEGLERKGVDISFHRGAPLKSEIAALLAPTGITLLGPSRAQILQCAQQIATTNDEAADAAVDLTVGDTADIIGLYRSIAKNPADPASRNPRGNGMNCQSICLAFGPPRARVLLAGDMQFTDPGVVGAEEEMETLRDAVAAHGPYVLFKTTHHTSHNGQDDDFLDALGKPRLIVHSGGLHDASHPGPAVLRMLARRTDIEFARTDRNGHIEVRPHARSQAIKVSRGALNDFTENRTRDVTPPVTARSPETPAAASVAAASAAERQPGQGPQIIIVNLPPGPIDMRVAGVEIVVRDTAYVQSPSHGTGHRLPDRDRSAPGPSGDGQTVAPGRSIAGLVFVTDLARLAANIGRAETDQVLAEIERRGGTLVTGDSDRLEDLAQDRLRALPDSRGVILLGGYDVVPSARRDVLDPDLRRQLGRRVEQDQDFFWVWSDSSYADVDGDAIAEYPVSRVPDARDARLFLSAMAAAPLRRAERFGIHNLARPFAIDIWNEVIGTRAIEVCEAFGPHNLSTDMLRSSCHYYMLHGAEEDGSEFVGETANGRGYPTAFLADRVPQRFDGLAFSGCCWGALIVEGKAYDASSATPPPRMAERSIALSYLKAGAIAFIGCTGSHYSGPSTDPDVNYAMRLHRAFWEKLRPEQASPALALFQAKQDYANSIIGSGRGLDPLDTARRLKNLAQFTCLGLGW